MAVHNSNTYAALPTVAQAGESYLKQNASDRLNGIGSLFFEYKMQEKFGLALLHRHFELSDAEQIVEYGGVATPWPVDSVLPAGSSIKPTNWSLQSGTAQPYEFEFIPRSEVELRKETQIHIPDMFIERLHQALEKDHLLDIFGLVKLPGGVESRPTFEATIGRASVTFPGDDMNKGVPAMWYFDKDGSGVCARVCSQCKDFGTC